MATQATIDEARTAIEEGYQASYIQLACAAGRITTDPTSQTIQPGATATLQIISVRFDSSPTMINGNNILLQNQKKVYNASVSVTASSAVHVDGVMSLDLYWFDGTLHNLLQSQDVLYVAAKSEFSIGTSTCLKSIDRNDNYIYCQLTNGCDVPITIDRYRFSCVRAC